MPLARHWSRISAELANCASSGLSVALGGTSVTMKNPQQMDLDRTPGGRFGRLWAGFIKWSSERRQRIQAAQHQAQSIPASPPSKSALRRFLHGTRRIIAGEGTATM
jgi:hypothetical protein